MQPIHVALVVAALACVSDWRSRRIPNLLTFTSAIAAIACQFLIGGTSAAMTSATGWFVGIALFFQFLPSAALVPGT